MLVTGISTVFISKKSKDENAVPRNYSDLPLVKVMESSPNFGLLPGSTMTGIYFFFKSLLPGQFKGSGQVNWIRGPQPSALPH